MTFGRHFDSSSHSPSKPGTYKRCSFFSEVRHCQVIRWWYRDTKGKLYSGIEGMESEAKLEAEKQSGEKIRS